MEESYNKEAHSEESYNKSRLGENQPKTSSTESADDPRNTAESQEQKGIGVANSEKAKSYEKSEEQEEFIDNANNNTAAGNDDPVQDGKGMTMSAYSFFNDEDDDDEDEDDDDDDEGDDPLTIGDDPAETKKKIPVM